ncbi:hypothetical protein N658DRAFT_80795 [Parathielavia hyrcaniae]|uniref:Uncharacterized protein n=1 Tax=Parathielavia hyrcaniae TaxID=113614 RepID=A0AAN6Q040_9PEZI|nr:hypothetical protein N658DRAFT_80795 [Parathielavia hyrcaniae]
MEGGGQWTVDTRRLLKFFGQWRFRVYLAVDSSSCFPILYWDTNNYRFLEVPPVYLRLLRNELNEVLVRSALAGRRQRESGETGITARWQVEWLERLMNPSSRRQLIGSGMNCITGARGRCNVHNTESDPDETASSRNSKQQKATCSKNETESGIPQSANARPIGSARWSRAHEPSITRMEESTWLMHDRLVSQRGAELCGGPRVQFATQTPEAPKPAISASSPASQRPELANSMTRTTIPSVQRRPIRHGKTQQEGEMENCEARLQFHDAVSPADPSQAPRAPSAESASRQW